MTGWLDKFYACFRFRGVKEEREVAKEESSAGFDRRIHRHSQSSKERLSTCTSFVHHEALDQQVPRPWFSRLTSHRVGRYFLFHFVQYFSLHSSKGEFQFSPNIIIFFRNYLIFTCKQVNFISSLNSNQSLFHFIKNLRRVIVTL